MKRSLWWKILLPAALLLILVVGITQRKAIITTVMMTAYIAPHWKTFKTVAARLPEERAAARKAGLPLAQADLKRSPALTPAENAAPLYREAFTHLDRLSEADTKAISDYLKPENRSPERGRKVRLLLRSLQPALALSEKATRRPHCDFTVSSKSDEQSSMTMEFSEMKKMRALARLFAVRSVIQAEAGKPSDALRSIETGARIGRHAAEEPFLVPGLVLIAVKAVQHDRFIDVLKQYGDKPQTLAQARATHAAFGIAPDVRDAFRGEVAMTVQAMDKLPTDLSWMKEFVETTPYPKLAISQRRTLADAWQVRLLEFWRAGFVVLNKAGDDKATASEDFERLVTQNEKRWKYEPTFIMNNILMPVFIKAGWKYVQCQSEERLRSTTITLLETRNRTGQFPAALPPKTLASTDPFTRQPLRYRRVGKGFLLYSVGINLKDDGGISRPSASSGTRKSKEGGPDDMVVSYP